MGSDQNKLITKINDIGTGGVIDYSYTGIPFERKHAPLVLTIETDPQSPIRLENASIPLMAVGFVKPDLRSMLVAASQVDRLPKDPASMRLFSNIGLAIDCGFNNMHLIPGMTQQDREKVEDALAVQDVMIHSQKSTCGRGKSVVPADGLIESAMQALAQIADGSKIGRAHV